MHNGGRNFCLPLTVRSSVDMDGREGFVERDAEPFLVGAEVASEESRSLNHARNRSLHLPVQVPVVLTSFGWLRGRLSSFVVARDRFRMVASNPQGPAGSILMVAPLLVPASDQLEDSDGLLHPVFPLIQEASRVRQALVDDGS